MGTTWQVTIRHLPQGHSHQELNKRIAAEFNLIDAQASHWRPDSPVSRFNRTFTTEPFPIKPDLQRIIIRAQDLHKKTSGAFDITIAPLVNLWGFGPVKSTRGYTPSDEEIEKALVMCGMQKLKLLPDDTIRKTIPGLQIDLSALAKGYAIDRVADLLDTLDIQDYLIECGGELRGRGDGSGGVGWQVAIESPVGSGASRIIALVNSAIATSGNYRRLHIINPKTGRPVETRTNIISVVAPTAMEADAWATACLVLDHEACTQLAQQEKFVVYR
jgi:FAD:protein FMN transferase